MILRSSSPTFPRKLFRTYLGYESLSTAVSESNSFPVIFVVENFLWLRHTKEGSVETIEAMVSDVVHTLDNNGQVANEPMPPRPSSRANWEDFGHRVSGWNRHLPKWCLNLSLPEPRSLFQLQAERLLLIQKIATLAAGT